MLPIISDAQCRHALTAQHTACGPNSPNAEQPRIARRPRIVERGVFVARELSDAGRHAPAQSVQYVVGQPAEAHRQIGYSPLVFHRSRIGPASGAARPKWR